MWVKFIHLTPKIRSYARGEFALFKQRISHFQRHLLFLDFWHQSFPWQQSMNSLEDQAEEVQVVRELRWTPIQIQTLLIIPKGRNIIADRLCSFFCLTAFFSKIKYPKKIKPPFPHAWHTITVTKSCNTGFYSLPQPWEVLSRCSGRAHLIVVTRGESNWGHLPVRGRGGVALAPGRGRASGGRGRAGGLPGAPELWTPLLQ